MQTPYILKVTVLVWQAFLLTGCTVCGTSNPPIASQTILFQGSNIEVPADLAIDLRFTTPEKFSAILREPTDIGFAAKGISISFIIMDDEAEAILSEIGYGIEVVCGHRVLVRERNGASRSVLIIVKQGFVQLENLPEFEEKVILESLCQN